ncbi:ERAD-associated protein [Gurleya vavrai]
MIIFLLINHSFQFINNFLTEKPFIKESLEELQKINTSDSHVIQYFIQKNFNKNIKKAVCHLYAGNKSQYFNLIYAYNSYFSVLFNCDYEKIANLYLKPATEIFENFNSNKYLFKTKRLFEELEAQKNIGETMDHISNLIAAGDTKAEDLFLKMIQSGRAEPGKYEEMLKLLAEKGNTKAMGILGDMYYDGWGVEKCESTAMHYFTEGVNRKNASCLNGMALIYKKNKEYQLAKKYFEEASRRGLPEADYNLYVFYKEHLVSEEIAIAYLLTAANSGFLPAIYTYALKLLSSKNYRSAVLYLCAICDYSYLICDLLDKAEDLYLKENYEKTLTVLLFASEMGSTHAIKNILYLCEKVKKIDFYDKNSLIFDSHKKMTDMGYKTNLVGMGDCFFYGIGIEKSYRDAFSFYLAACLNKTAEGAYSLSYLYEYGLGVEKNLHKSIHYILEIKKYEDNAYLLVWYVLLKLSFKLSFHYMLKKEVLAAVFTGFISFIVYKKVKNNGILQSFFFN